MNAQQGLGLFCLFEALISPNIKPGNCYLFVCLLKVLIENQHNLSYARLYVIQHVTDRAQVSVECFRNEDCL